VIQRLLTALLMVTAMGFLAHADDEKKPKEEKKPVAKIDWSAWVDHGTFVGEVTRIEKDGSFTVTQKTKQMQPAQPGRQATMKTISTKKQMSYSEEGMLRVKDLPPKLNEKGKKVPYTAEEMKQLKSPAGTPGYATERSSLTVGQIVEVTLVRPKSVKPAEVAPQDLRVKWAVILSSPVSVEPGKDDKKDPKKKPS
jgi:hypothetical protein